MQVIKTPDARAVSMDCINWKVHIRTRLGLPSPFSYYQQESAERFAFYGVWSMTEGMSTIPMNPMIESHISQQQADDILAVLEQQTGHAPFVLNDPYELWLLDHEKHMPLALLASATSENQMDKVSLSKWKSAGLSENGFNQIRFDGFEQPKQDLESIINKLAGGQLYAQWFYRADGIGTGLNGVHLHKDLKQRILYDQDFPILTLRRDYADKKHTQLIDAYITWLAPLLLTLPKLGDDLRRQLEHRAKSQAALVKKMHHAYPVILDKKNMNAILVEAVMRESV